RFDGNKGILGVSDSRQADQMTVSVDVVFVGLTQRENTILQHRTAVTEHQRRRQTMLPILAWHDLVSAFRGEEAKPFLVLRRVDQRPVLREQVENTVAADCHRTAPAGSMPISSA